MIYRVDVIKRMEGVYYVSADDAAEAERMVEELEERESRTRTNVLDISATLIRDPEEQVPKVVIDNEMVRVGDVWMKFKALVKEER